MSLVRGTALLGFQELMRELGADPLAYLARAHIQPEAAGDEDSFISVRGAIAVLETAATDTSTPDLGRRLAARHGLEILGPVGVAARTAVNVGAGLQAVGQYMSVLSPALSATVEFTPDGRSARLLWSLLLDHPPPHRQVAEAALGQALRIIRLLAGPDFTPTVVHFRHEALMSTEAYVDYFGCPVRFGQATTGFLFSPSILARPLAADSAVHDLVREYLNSIVVPATTQLQSHILVLIRRMLPTGGCTIDLVASHLALHPRTLQRQLAAERTSFAALVDEVRRDEARRYLRETDVPLSQLAGLLGYSEQSVLSRSCRRWFGMSATSLRLQGPDQVAVVAEGS